MIKLYTDTSANLPHELVINESIEVIPFGYTVNGRMPDMTLPFDGASFYDSMRAGADVRTSMINPESYKNAFEKALANGDDVIYVGMSGGISGSAHSASLAADELREMYADRKIAVIDTLAASLGEGLQVIRAAELAKADGDFEKICGLLESEKKCMCQYFTVDDLKYLHRGGRLSRVAAAIGSLLNIKPILTGDEGGRIVSCGKARGKKAALSELANRYAKLSADRRATIGIAHGDDPAGAAQLLELLHEKGFEGECINVCYEPVTGSHVGPGTIALFFRGIHK